jgi:hypothetical protein
MYYWVLYLEDTLKRTRLRGTEYYVLRVTLDSRVSIAPSIGMFDRTKTELSASRVNVPAVLTRTEVITLVAKQH